jgi:hypothetical protein
MCPRSSTRMAQLPISSQVKLLNLDPHSRDQILQLGARRGGTSIAWTSGHRLLPTLNWASHFSGTFRFREWRSRKRGTQPASSLKWLAITVIASYNYARLLGSNAHLIIHTVILDTLVTGANNINQRDTTTTIICSAT